jgi:hypothetical protein
MVHPRYSYDRRATTRDTAVDLAVRAVDARPPEGLLLVAAHFLDNDGAWIEVEP